MDNCFGSQHIEVDGTLFKKCSIGSALADCIGNEAPEQVYFDDGRELDFIFLDQ